MPTSPEPRQPCPRQEPALSASQGRSVTRALLTLALIGVTAGWTALAGGGTPVRPLAPDVRVTETTAYCGSTSSNTWATGWWCSACTSRPAWRPCRRYDAGFTFSLLTGPDPGQAVARRFQVRALPTTVFIDRDGAVQDVRRGQLTEEQLLRSLKRIL